MSWNALLNIRARLDYLQQHRDRTLDVRVAYEKQFNIGKRTLLDLLDIENELFRARSDYVTGSFTELFGTYRVIASSGELNSAIK